VEQVGLRRMNNCALRLMRFLHLAWSTVIH